MTTENNATGGETSAEVSAQTSDGTEGQSSSSEVNEASSTENQNSGVGDGEQESEFVKDSDGNEYIPKKAFEERLAKLTAQKYDAKSALLESIKSDPAAKAEIMAALGLNQTDNTDQTKESSEPTMFQKWLAPLPPEHQAHYQGLVEAIAPDFESFVKEEIKNALAPYASYIGEQKVQSFAATNKDFGQYKSKIQEIMSSGRARTLEDAYVLASHEDKLKGVSAAVRSSEDQRRQQMQAPSNGRPNQSGNFKQKPGSLRDALRQAARETGYMQ